jgi:hypothetical protein
LLLGELTIMRAYIPALDTIAMPWEPGMLPGSFRKTLNSDPETGAATGFAQFKEGATVSPGKPHFHHIDEEILVTAGALTFDHRTWLPANGYCYHPPGTVHGFHSGFRGDAAFYSRNNGGGPFKLNYIDGEPEKREWYQAFGPEPKRPPAYIADYSTLGETIREDGSYRTLVSLNPDTGEGSMFLRLPSKWTNSNSAGTKGFYREMFVLQGDAMATDGNRFGVGFYAFIPPDIAHGFVSSEAGALIFVSFGGGETA